MRGEIAIVPDERVVGIRQGDKTGRLSPAVHSKKEVLSKIGVLKRADPNVARLVRPGGEMGSLNIAIDLRDATGVIPKMAVSSVRHSQFARARQVGVKIATTGILGGRPGLKGQGAPLRPGPIKKRA